MSSDKYSGNSNEAYSSYRETSTNIPVAGDEFKKNESPPDYWASNTVNPDTQYVPTGDTHVEGVGFDEVNRKPFLLKVIGTVVVMMGVLTAMIAWLLTDYDALCYVQTETWVFWVFLFAAPIVCGLTFCVDALVRKFPLNIITLVVWTGLFSMFIAMVATIWVFYSSFYDGSVKKSCNCFLDQDGSMFVPEECINQALGVIAPAGLGTAVIFASTIIITLCGFDIIKHFKIFLIIYFVLSWPLGFIGWLILPFDVYWAILWSDRFKLINIFKYTINLVLPSFMVELSVFW